jgi:sphinganine-1-phosphate aldolase
VTMDATMQLVHGLDNIPEVYCLKPNGESNLISFASRDPDLDIYAVADRLEERGWLRGRMRDRQAIQQGVNPAHLAVVPEYLDAVREAIAFVKAQKTARVAYDEHSY